MIDGYLVAFQNSFIKFWCNIKYSNTGKLTNEGKGKLNQENVLNVVNN